MGDFERIKLEEKIQNILEKHKGKSRLYPKMENFSRRFMNCHYTNPKYYRKLAKLTSKINFRCNFKDGFCKSHRSTKMCCCNSCRQSFGHFRERFFTDYYNKKQIEEELLYYARRYSKETGFWRENKGCILPRERRSATCLCYNCTRPTLTCEEKLLFDILRNSGKFPSYIKRLVKMLKEHFLYREV